MIQEEQRLADIRLRAHYIALGLIVPKDYWRHEVEEYEAARNTPARKPGSSIRIVNPERSRAG